jgi:tRNA-dihydrouridine synthase
MLGRGLYGRPWAPARIEAGLRDVAFAEPDLERRFAIVLDHLRETLAFYGDAIGLRMFRKHLGWYVEGAPTRATNAERRAAKAAICRLETPADVERALAALWLADDERLAA